MFTVDTYVIIIVFILFKNLSGCMHVCYLYCKLATRGSISARRPVSASTGRTSVTASLTATAVTTSTPIAQQVRLVPYPSAASSPADTYSGITRVFLEYMVYVEYTPKILRIHRVFPVYIAFKERVKLVYFTSDVYLV